MPVSMNSSKARLKDGHTEPVRSIVDSYELQDIRIDLQHEAGHWFLQIEDDRDPEWEPDWEPDDEPDEGDRELWKWPRAVRRDRLPSRERFPDEKSWNSARAAVYLAEEGQDFRALLVELADHLETPLVVVTLSRDLEASRGPATAEALAVQPGGKQVESVHVDF
jgi:hypothetical protein